MSAAAEALPRQNAQEDSSDMYSTMKQLQRQLEFLAIQEGYVKDETQNLKRELLRAQEVLHQHLLQPLHPNTCYNRTFLIQKTGSEAHKVRAAADWQLQRDDRRAPRHWADDIRVLLLRARAQHHRQRSAEAGLQRCHAPPLQLHRRHSTRRQRHQCAAHG